MARTAPVPNIPPIPGMCPSIAVMAGGGAGGGGSGKAGGSGSGSASGAGGGGGDAAGGDGRSAGSSSPNAPCGPGGSCGNPHSATSAGDPVDVVTGRVFTVPTVDLELPGPLPFKFMRHYDLRLRKKDAALGPGWSNSLGWVLVIHRSHIDVTHPAGHTVQFDMAPNDVVGEAHGWSLRRDSQGFVVQAGDGLARRLSPTSDPETFVLTETRDRNGNVITVAWTKSAIVVTDSVQRTIRMPLDADGHITSLQVVLPDGTATTFARYAYAGGLLEKVDDADGFSQRFAYGPSAELVTATNRVGVETRYQYDDQLRCYETWQTISGGLDASVDPSAPTMLADGTTRVKGARHVRLLFDPAANCTDVVSSLRVDRIFGDPSGRVFKSVVGGGVSTMAYDANGEMTGAQDQLGRTTSFEYDRHRRLVAVTDPLGKRTEFSRNIDGDVVRVTRPNGGVEITDYDPKGNVLRHSDASGAITAYNYDARGLLVEEVRPDGATVTVTYDAHGNAVRVKTAEGGEFERRFDYFGRRIEEIDPAKSSSKATYSLRGDVLAIVTANGTHSFTYDGERRVISEVDGVGRRSTTAYGLVGTTETVSADGGVMKFFHDLEGELVRVLNEDGEEHVLERDPRGHVTREKTFDGRELRFRHDAAGQLTRMIDADGSIHDYEYDEGGRIILHKLPTGAQIEREFDDGGAVIRVSQGRVVTRYERDLVGRVTNEAQSVDGVEHWVKTSRDGAGREVRLETSAGHVRDVVYRQHEIDWILDGKDSMTRQIDGSGRETTRLLPRGGKIQRGFGPVGELTSASSIGPLGAIELALELRYDAASQIAAVELDGTTKAISRDAAARVAVFGSEEYRHSPADVLYEHGPNARPRKYEPGGRLVEHGATKLTWNQRAQVETIERTDSAGVVQRQTFAFDALGYLSSVKTAGGDQIEYVYDTRGRCLKKTVYRGTSRVIEKKVRWVWDGDVPIHRIEGEATDTFAYDRDELLPIGTRRGGSAAAWSHWVTDDLAAPVAEVGGDGRVLRKVSRTAWGVQSKADGDPGLMGQIWDETLGVYLNRHRLYEPESGTYLSADPFGLPGGAHLYSYPDDPFGEADPFGLAFSKKTKQQKLDEARDENGDVRCQNPECNDGDPVVCVKPEKSMSGVTPPQEEWQFDHKKPKAKGGSDSARNCEVLCRKCNRAKSDNY